jgi:hypothetical protein
MTAIESVGHRPLPVAVFTQPREAIDRILASQSRHLVLPLAAAGGIAFYVGWVLNLGFLLFENWRLFLTFAVIGAIVSITGLYLTAPIFSWIGRYADGYALPVQLRAAWAWSFLPNIFCFLGIVTILMATKAFYPNDLFVPPGLLLVVKVATAISRIWGWIIFLVMASQVHRLPFWWTFVTCAVGIGLIVAIAILTREILGYLLNIPPILFNIREYLLQLVP